MQRLTARNDAGCAYLVHVKPNEQEVESSHKNTLQCILDCFNRLAAIEDILYAPDGTELTTLDRLRELVEADRDGRCVVLPCKVGSDFYDVHRGGDKPLTPCDLCIYGPPSSLDGKPCKMCPASSKPDMRL